MGENNVLEYGQLFLDVLNEGKETNRDEVAVDEEVSLIPEKPEIIASPPPPPPLHPVPPPPPLPHVPKNKNKGRGKDKDKDKDKEIEEDDNDDEQVTVKPDDRSDTPMMSVHTKKDNLTTPLHLTPSSPVALLRLQFHFLLHLLVLFLLLHLSLHLLNLFRSF